MVFPPACDQRIQLRVRWKPLEREQSAADLRFLPYIENRISLLVANPAAVLPLIGKITAND